MADSKQSTRVATLKLSDEMIQQLAKELGIRNLDRIPRELLFRALPQEMELGALGRGVSINSGVAIQHIVP